MPTTPKADPVEKARTLFERHLELKAVWLKVSSEVSSGNKNDRLLALSKEIRELSRALREQAKRERELARAYSDFNASKLRSGLAACQDAKAAPEQATEHIPN